ncbi:hypothetical protein [Parasynechococcus marenigrum]|uniref:hypothetical protein n=1 Tax=Parasynechococcus marenigrum TaxID=2881428 RepID=UPI0002EBDE3A|nr:hypothetical protein [Parasynechococcus marenigrum]
MITKNDALTSGPKQLKLLACTCAVNCLTYVGEFFFQLLIIDLKRDLQAIVCCSAPDDPASIFQITPVFLAERER